MIFSACCPLTVKCRDSTDVLPKDNCLLRWSLGRISSRYNLACTSGGYTLMFYLHLEIPKISLPGRRHPDPGIRLQEHQNKHSRMFGPCLRPRRGLSCSLNQHSKRHPIQGQSRAALIKVKNFYRCSLTIAASPSKYSPALTSSGVIKARKASCQHRIDNFDSLIIVAAVKTVNANRISLLTIGWMNNF